MQIIHIYEIERGDTFRGACIRLGLAARTFKWAVLEALAASIRIFYGKTKNRSN